MGNSLPMFLLALFIIRGLSLECEECIGLADCSGRNSPCGSGKDRCSVTKMTFPIGVFKLGNFKTCRLQLPEFLSQPELQSTSLKAAKIEDSCLLWTETQLDSSNTLVGFRPWESVPRLSVTIKSCTSSDTCDKGVQVINMGQGEHVVAQLRCCEGDGCRDVVHTELPMEAAANGKQCPACFAMGETCQEEFIDCTGDELYCAEGRLDATLVSPGMEVNLKGCANKAFCDSLVGYEALAPKNSGSHSLQCKSNSSIYQDFSTSDPESDSGVVHTNPRWFGFFITILSGLIVKMSL